VLRPEWFEPELLRRESERDNESGRDERPFTTRASSSIQPANVRLSELRDQEEAMTTLENRPNTAVLVIDVQNGVVGDAYERDTVVANVGTVVEKARAAEIPVVWVQHSSDNLAQGSEQWKIVPELSPDESEPLGPEAVSGLVRGDDSRVGPRRAHASGASSSSARRRTNASARRCTAHSFAATTRRSSAMPHTTEDLSPWGAPPPEARHRAHKSLLGQS
jgi:hypothetical protein